MINFILKVQQVMQKIWENRTEMMIYFAEVEKL
jgi:hypothetical protein